MKSEIKIKVKNCPLIPISKLEIIQGNLKELSKAGYEKLKKRIARLGFDAPVFVWKGKVLDGTQRIRTVQKMIEDGYSLSGNKLPIVEIQAKDLNEAKERLLGYISQFGKVTDEGLYEFAHDIPDLDFDSLDLPDFNMDKFKIGWFEKEIAQTGEDDIPEVPKKAKSKRGQIYQLDRHRVMCGDSTCREDVDKLMDGKRADMVFTDPPYGIDLDTNWDQSKISLREWRGKKKYYKKIEGDNVDYVNDILQSIINISNNINEVFIWGVDYFAELIPDRNKGSWIVWDKRDGDKLDKVMGSHFELCWSKKNHQRQIIRVKWCGLYGTEQEHDHKRTHPTQKPVKLAEWFIERFSKELKLIVDLFLGSGSTLIACEKINRICYGMEIDPIYVDVIIKRWEDYTGKKAKLISKGFK